MGFKVALIAPIILLILQESSPFAPSSTAGFLSCHLPYDEHNTLQSQRYSAHLSNRHQPFSLSSIKEVGVQFEDEDHNNMDISLHKISSLGANAQSGIAFAIVALSYLLLPEQQLQTNSDSILYTTSRLAVLEQPLEISGLALAAASSIIFGNLTRHQEIATRSDGNYYLSNMAQRRLNFGIFAYSLLGLLSQINKPGMGIFICVNSNETIRIAFLLPAIFAFVVKVLSLRQTGMQLIKSIPNTRVKEGGILDKTKSLYFNLSNWWLGRCDLDGTGSSDFDSRALYLGRKKNIFSLIHFIAMVCLINNVFAYQHISTIKLSGMKKIYMGNNLASSGRLFLVASLSSILKVITKEGRQTEKVYKQMKYILLGWIGTVGILSGFINGDLVSFIIQKAMYFLIFAYPIMFKGMKDNADSKSSDDKISE